MHRSQQTEIETIRLRFVLRVTGTIGETMTGERGQSGPGFKISAPHRLSLDRSLLRLLFLSFFLSRLRLRSRPRSRSRSRWLCERCGEREERLLRSEREEEPASARGGGTIWSPKRVCPSRPTVVPAEREDDAAAAADDDAAPPAPAAPAAAASPCLASSRCLFFSASIAMTRSACRASSRLSRASA